MIDWHPIQGGVEILLVASCSRNHINTGLMGHLACTQTLLFIPKEINSGDDVCKGALDSCILNYEIVFSFSLPIFDRFFFHTDFRRSSSITCLQRWRNNWKFCQVRRHPWPRLLCCRCRRLLN